MVTPFRGMLRVRDELLAELYTWLASHDIEPTGPFFLRLHVIDMEGPMDLEVGVVTTSELEGDDRVRPGVLPAGGYATLTYVDHARRANRALIEWTRDNGIALIAGMSPVATPSPADTRLTSLTRGPNRARPGGRSSST